MTGTLERLPRSCPLGVCDGSGWVLHEDDSVAACDCRERRVQQARTQGVRSVLPTKYQGVGFDRPPISDMARDPQKRTAFNVVKTFIDEIGSNLADGRGLWLEGDVGTGKTTLAMLVSKKAIEAGHSVAIYSLPKLLARIRRTYEGESRGALIPRVLPPLDRCRPSPHRRPRRREEQRLGARTALLDRR